MLRTEKVSASETVCNVRLISSITVRSGWRLSARPGAAIGSLSNAPRSSTEERHVETLE